MAIFTLAELNKLSKKALERLASYYKLEYNGLNKTQLIDKLLQIFIEPSESVDDGEVQMSVRVRRIKESSKNG